MYVYIPDDHPFYGENSRGLEIPNIFTIIEKKAGTNDDINKVFSFMEQHYTFGKYSKLIAYDLDTGVQKCVFIILNNKNITGYYEVRGLRDISSDNIIGISFSKDSKTLSKITTLFNEFEDNNEFCVFSEHVFNKKFKYVYRNSGHRSGFPSSVSQFNNQTDPMPVLIRDRLSPFFDDEEDNSDIGLTFFESLNSDTLSTCIKDIVINADVNNNTIKILLPRIGFKYHGKIKDLGRILFTIDAEEDSFSVKGVTKLSQNRIHPHINSSHICLGNVSGDFRNAIQRNDFSYACLILLQACLGVDVTDRAGKNIADYSNAVGDTSHLVLNKEVINGMGSGS
jgi:hypothetical protein